MGFIRSLVNSKGEKGPRNAHSRGQKNGCCGIGTCSGFDKMTLEDPVADPTICGGGMAVRAWWIPRCDKIRTKISDVKK